MLVRAAYLAMLAAFLGGVILVVTGLVSGQWRLVAAGIGAWVVGALTRGWLRRTGKWAQADAAFNAMTACGPPVNESRVAELVALLRQWEAHEQKRGSAEFDPWALQVVRNDIRALVADDPALEQLLHEHRQRRVA
jgi:hypothetical protein